MHVVFLLLLTIGTGFSTQSAPNSTWWPCTSLVPYQNLQLDQVLGQWYLVESISALPGQASTCAGIRLHANDNSWKNLTMIGHHELGGHNGVSFENHTIIVPDPVTSPSLWDHPDIGSAVMIVDVAPNNDTLAMTTCQRFLQYDWTGVFSRERSVNSSVLSVVNERLRAAGLQRVDNAVPITAACASV